MRPVRFEPMIFRSYNLSKRESNTQLIWPSYLGFNLLVLICQLVGQESLLHGWCSLLNQARGLGGPASSRRWPRGVYHQGMLGMPVEGSSTRHRARTSRACTLTASSTGRPARTPTTCISCATTWLVRCVRRRPTWCLLPVAVRVQPRMAWPAVCTRAQSTPRAARPGQAAAACWGWPRGGHSSQHPMGSSTILSK